MTIATAIPGLTSGNLVVALHCSGGRGGQWRPLGKQLKTGFTVDAPNLADIPQTAGWNNSSISCAAMPHIARIDRHDGPVHLVGHSYGGVVVLHIAASRPERVASLTLYEPAAFQLLKELGPAGAGAIRDIAALAARIRDAVATNRTTDSAAQLVDYWDGRGAWKAMDPKSRNEIAACLLELMLKFQAIFDDPMGSADLAGCRFPVLIMHGDRSPAPSRLVVRHLTHRMAGAASTEVAGAGHLGPITHPYEIARRMARHIRMCPVVGL